MKPLEEMTNEELWRLFPIIICKHQPCWKQCYTIEKENIENAISSANIIRINHIGSTAVPNLLAKPTIDILLEIKDDTNTAELIDKIKSIGYIYSHQPNNPPPHMMFMKGYTPNGFKGQAFHLHVRYKGDWDEIYFRDYLIAHPETANEYGLLKLRLEEQFKHDRDAYTHAKTSFIRKITAISRNNKQ